ncbi:hypothetical protein IAI10_16615 [Clostridium sp. 19966]|uniref:hypothetical protein n=1 Tax=Clostridium sp. 19966 TaxID=2768166 RepID=UPI0028DF8E87|nr:hypothetical protein [Clostridium sp. 19966]MDT8718292.1 hypothetical protein [Clostridium sp. 19966]
MGRKIKEAMYLKSEIKIEDANKAMNGLTCKYCGAALTYVGKYKKQMHEKEIYINPYFRLANKKADHAITCKYNLVGQLKIAARESDDNILEQIDDGKFSFRMHLISESLREIGKHTKTEEETDEEHGGTGKEKKYTKKNPRLDSYLSTMNKIIELRSLLEENEDISPKVKLTFKTLGGKEYKITWNNFYYEIDRVSDMYEYISKNKIKHPTCVDGIIKKITPPTDKFEFYSVQLESPKSKKMESDFYLPSIQIIIKDHKLDKQIIGSAGKQIIAYCNFWDNGIKKWGDKNVYFQNIRGDIWHKNQFIIQE